MIYQDGEEIMVVCRGRDRPAEACICGSLDASLDRIKAIVAADLEAGLKPPFFKVPDASGMAHDRWERSGKARLALIDEYERRGRLLDEILFFAIRDKRRRRRGKVGAVLYRMAGRPHHLHGR